MYVLIPLLFSAICSFVNPYVGLFSMFTIVEIIIIFCVDINANIRMRQWESQGKSLRQQSVFLLSFLQ